MARPWAFLRVVFGRHELKPETRRPSRDERDYHRRVAEHVTNAWGEEIEVVEDPDDSYWVPPEERKDTDDDPDANALRTDPFDPDSDDDDLVHEGPE